MDEKIKKIEFDILPLNYLNIFKAKEYIKYLISRIKEITDKWESLKFKVFDLEAKVKELEEEGGEDCRQHNLMVEQLSEHIKKLEEAIDKHEQFKRTHEKVVALEDELLYATFEGMKGE